MDARWRDVGSSPTPNLKIGVVGAGWISTVYHLPILSEMDGTTVSYIADIDESSARYASNTYGGDAIGVDHPSDLPECDALLLAIPAGARGEYVREFGSRGTAIFCEKPFATTEKMHRKFRNRCEFLFANYQRTCYANVNQVKAMITDGLFGELNRVSFREGRVGGPDTGIGPNHYRTDLSLAGGGVLLEIGCHGLSELVHLLDSWDLSVSDAEIEWNEEFDTEIRAQLTAESGDRTVPVEFEISSIHNIGKRARFEFDHAEVIINPFRSESPVTVETDSGAELTFRMDETWATSHHQGVYLRWLQFIHYVSDHESGQYLKTFPEVTALIEGIYSKADRARPLEVES